MSWRRLVYSLLFYSLLPVLLLRLIWRGRKNSALWSRLPERFGFVSTPAQSSVGLICIHAVSVGEVMAARTLIESLLAAYPTHQLWVSTTTPTGSDTVLRLFGQRVEHSYLPYDTPGAVGRFIRRLNPKVFLVMETELWPNLYAACGQADIPLLLLNARLSVRSVHRYTKIPYLVGEALSHVSRIMARDQQDAEHFLQLGVQQSQVEVSGNIKFDLSIDESVVTEGHLLREEFRPRPVWCAGSTHEGEEAQLIEVHAKLLRKFPDLLLILVPRHPERFSVVADLCRKSGLGVARRSRHEKPNEATAILLGDSMGELLLWYAASDMAFIGGSLVPVGGHNPLEALAFGIPVLSGQHVHNFLDLYPVLTSTRSAKLVESTTELHDYIAHWLNDEADRLLSGRAGARFLRENGGVVEHLMSVIGAYTNGR